VSRRPDPRDPPGPAGGTDAEPRPARGPVDPRNEEPMRPNRTRTTILRTAGLLLAGLAAAPESSAQTGAEDSGTFRVVVEGREVGTEEFSIRETGAGTNAEVSATGRVSLALPTGTLELQSRVRTTGMQANPVSYEVSVGGTSPRRIVGTIGGGRFSATIVTASGEQLREYVASDGAVVLDEGIAHHYYFLARRLRSGSVPILIPRENRQVMATVTDRGQERVDVGGTAATLYHLVIQPRGGDERHVWVDDLNRVVKVEIPSRQYSAIRTTVPR